MLGVRARASRPRADRVFVYGTLTDPARLDAIVGQVSRWRYLGPATVRGTLYDAGSYPALRPSRSSRDTVPGRLVELTDSRRALALLDLYEGVPEGLYVRQRCRARTADAVRTAWVYVYAKSVGRMPRIAAWTPARRGGVLGAPLLD